MAARLGSFKAHSAHNSFAPMNCNDTMRCSNAASAAEAGKLLIRWKAPLRRQLVDQAR